MISGYLDEAFIKEASMTTKDDYVFIVRNLPKRLVYQEVPKMVQRIDRDGYSDGTLVPDPSGEKVEALLEGIEESRNGDGSLVFITKREVGKKALEAIDQYIAGTLPRDVVIPKRVPYSMVPQDNRSNPKPKTLIPAIDLPKPDIREEAEVASPPAQAAQPKPSRTLSPEQKAVRVEILRKAREAKAAKQAQQNK